MAINLTEQIYKNYQQESKKTLCSVVVMIFPRE